MPRDDEKMLRLLAGGVCRLGAAAQERNPTTITNNKTCCPFHTICGMLGCTPKRKLLMQARCRPTQPTTEAICLIAGREIAALALGEDSSLRTVLPLQYEAVHFSYPGKTVRQSACVPVG